MTVKYYLDGVLEHFNIDDLGDSVDNPNLRLIRFSAKDTTIISIIKVPKKNNVATAEATRAPDKRL